MRASPYDHPLQKMKNRGVVPQGCLQGGAMVAGMHMAGLDPCTGCEGPRQKCMGRPAAGDTLNRGQNARPEVALPDAFSGTMENSPPAARAQARRLQVEELKVLIMDRLAEQAKRRDEEPPPES